MDSVISVDDVAALYPDDLTDTNLLRAVTGRMAEASDLARFYGSSKWVSRDATPAVVRRIVASAVVRWLRNPDALITSRADDETLGWAQDRNAGEIYFTEQQIERLEAAANPTVSRKGFGSFGLVAWGTGPARGTPPPGYWATGDGGEPFHWFQEDWIGGDSA